MFDFRKIELSDKPWIDSILKMSDFRGCEYSFANNFAWHRLYETEICRYKDFYISKSEKDGLHFTYPAGQGDRAELFRELRNYSEEKGSPLCIISVTNDELALFEENFPNEYTVTTDEADYDYIYLAEKLRTLTGKSITASETTSTVSMRTTGTTQSLPKKISMTVSFLLPSLTMTTICTTTNPLSESSTR